MKLELTEITHASDMLKGFIKKTELIFSEFLSHEYGNDIYIKPENLQKTGAFKIRGAFNRIFNLSSEDKKRGLIAASAGNHAQGVALAAREAGVSAVIVMPETTPLIKVEATGNLGAEVVLSGDNYDEACVYAKKLAEKDNRVFIHPFDDPFVIAGQGTIGLEILAEMENADYILVPVGGGGLIAGIAAAVKQVNSEVKVIGVEPEGAACMKYSLEADRICYLPNVETIADGVAVKTPGEMTFSLVKEYVDEIITVSDSEIMDSLLVLIEKMKLVSEAAGAVSVAALKKLNIKNKKVVCIVSGGNIDVVTMSEMLNRGMVSRGRIFCFTMELKHKPGVLMKIMKILADKKANILKLDHDQFRTMNRFKSVYLEVTVETNGHKHVAEIIQALEEGGYKIEKVY